MHDKTLVSRRARFAPHTRIINQNVMHLDNELVIAVGPTNSHRGTWTAILTNLCDAELDLRAKLLHAVNELGLVRCGLGTHAKIFPAPSADTLIIRCAPIKVIWQQVLSASLSLVCYFVIFIHNPVPTTRMSCVFA